MTQTVLFLLWKGLADLKCYRLGGWCVEPKPAACILRKALSTRACWASRTAVLFLQTHHFFTFFLHSAWHQVLGDQPKMSQGVDRFSQASHLWLRFGQKHLSGPVVPRCLLARIRPSCPQPLCGPTHMEPQERAQEEETESQHQQPSDSMAF